MGRGDECHHIPGRRHIERGLPDPKGRPLEEVRAVRGDIAGRIDSLPADETLK
jgi:arsenate reductase